MYIYICINMSVYLYVCVHMSICVCVRACTYIYEGGAEIDE